MATAFVNALVQFAQEDPANAAAIVSLRAQAFQRILDGGGEVTSELSGSMNGQTFTYTVSKPADVLFTELSEVVDIFTNFTNNRASAFDFRYLQQT